MKVQKAVLKETGHIAIGVLLGDVLMCAVFAIVHKFDYTVVLGALLGTAIAVANFFLLGVTLQKAVAPLGFFVIQRRLRLRKRSGAAAEIGRILARRKRDHAEHLFAGAQHRAAGHQLVENEQPPFTDADQKRLLLLHALRQKP